MSQLARPLDLDALRRARKGLLFFRRRPRLERSAAIVSTTVRGKRKTQKKPIAHSGPYTPEHFDSGGRRVTPGSRAKNRPDRARNYVGCWS